MSEKRYGKIEDAIIELLDGEAQENALKFTAYLSENELSPISLPYEMDNGKQLAAKYSITGIILVGCWLKNMASGRFKSLIFLISVRIFTVTRGTKNLRKPYTTTSAFATHPAMMNAGEPKMLKSSEKSLKACVPNIPAIL